MGGFGFDPHDAEWETGSGLRTVWSSDDDCDESCCGTDDCDCGDLQPGRSAAEFFKVGPVCWCQMVSRDALDCPAHGEMLRAKGAGS